MKNRGGVIIIEKQKVALIKRVKGERTYFVFPGGQQEVGETIEQTSIREAYEELGVHVQIERLLTTVSFNGTQYYFLAHIMDGQFGTGTGEEFQKAAAHGTYEAVWVNKEDLLELDVVPFEVVQLVLNIE